MVFVRQADNLGPYAEIRLSHLGQGSLVARIAAFLSHPATHGATGLVAVALAGAAVLKSGEGQFPESVAEACIEANARRCGFRVGDDTFFVERHEMPAVTRVESGHRQGVPIALPPAGYSYVKDDGNYLTSGSEFVIAPDESAKRSRIIYGHGGYGDDSNGGDSASPVVSDDEDDERLDAKYLQDTDGNLLLGEDGEPLEAERRTSSMTGNDDYIPNEFEVDGIFDVVDGQPTILGMESPYQLSVSDTGNLPITDRWMKFRLEGPTRRYGQEYRLRNWVDRHDGVIVVLLGRLVERHDGRMVEFETDNETYAPHVPDDLLGWVPRGALVEVKGYTPNDEPHSLFILSWSEVDRPHESLAPKIAGDGWSGEVRHPERLREIFGEPGENEFFAVGHIRKGDGAAYFDVDGGRGYRIENRSAVRKILSGEVAAVLERRGESDEEGVQPVWLVKYQTAPWNTLD